MQVRVQAWCGQGACLVAILFSTTSCMLPQCLAQRRQGENEKGGLKVANVILISALTFIRYLLHVLRCPVFEHALSHLIFTSPQA
jgi:hypothetical protein